MTIDQLWQGTVINYPYRWSHQLFGPPIPKDRPACVVIRMKMPNGVYAYAIAAISDKEPKESNSGLEIPALELKYGGLSRERRAYLHLSEVNIDDTQSSPHLEFRMPIRGRFSAKFMKKVTGMLRDNLKAKRVQLINRKNG